MFIATLIRFIPTSLVYEDGNNGDKLCHRKSMRAADEKLIINKLVNFFYSGHKFLYRGGSLDSGVLNVCFTLHSIRFTAFFNINVYYGCY